MGNGGYYRSFLNENNEIRENPYLGIVLSKDMEIIGDTVEVKVGEENSQYSGSYSYDVDKLIAKEYAGGSKDINPQITVDVNGKELKIGNGKITDAKSGGDVYDTLHFDTSNSEHFEWNHIRDRYDRFYKGEFKDENKMGEAGVKIAARFESIALDAGTAMRFAYWNDKNYSPEVNVHPVTIEFTTKRTTDKYGNFIKDKKQEYNEVVEKYYKHKINFPDYEALKKELNNGEELMQFRSGITAEYFSFYGNTGEVFHSMYNIIDIRDSDGDGIMDEYETKITRTDPYDPDTDGDGKLDGEETVDHHGVSVLPNGSKFNVGDGDNRVFMGLTDPRVAAHGPEAINKVNHKEYPGKAEAKITAIKGEKIIGRIGRTVNGKFEPYPYRTVNLRIFDQKNANDPKVGNDDSKYRYKYWGSDIGSTVSDADGNFEITVGKVIDKALGEAKKNAKLNNFNNYVKLKNPLINDPAKIHENLIYVDADPFTVDTSQDELRLGIETEGWNLGEPIYVDNEIGDTINLISYAQKFEDETNKPDDKDKIEVKDSNNLTSEDEEKIVDKIVEENPDMKPYLKDPENPKKNITIKDGKVNIDFGDNSKIGGTGKNDAQSFPVTDFVKKEASKPAEKVTQNGDKITAETKAPKGSEVDLKDPKGNVIAKGTVGEGGKIELTIPEKKKADLNGKEVKVVVTEKDKAPNDEGKITLDTEAPDKPVVNQATEKENSVKVKLPDNAVAGDELKITVTPKEGEAVTISHKITDADLNAENKTIEVKESDDKKVSVPELKAGDKVVADLTDKAGNKSEKSDEMVVANAPKVTGKPSIAEDLVAGDTTVEVNLPDDAKAGDTVKVKVGDKEVTHEITEDDKKARKVSVTVDALEEGNKVTAVVENEAGESEAAEKTVANAPKVTGKPSIAEDLVAGDTTVEVNLPDDAKAGDTVKVKVGDKEVTHEITEDDKKARKVSVTVDALEEGHTVEVKFTNKSGESETAEKTVGKEEHKQDSEKEDRPSTSHRRHKNRNKKKYDVREEVKEVTPVLTTYNHKAYIFGYPDGTVRPNRQITRAEAAAMIARLQNLNLGDMSKPNFADTNSSWYNSVINAVVKAGFMKGYPDGTFKPNQPITRAEFAQIIANIDKANNGIAPFADVRGHWAENAINKVFANGRIDGYPDGTFKPNANITRAEAAKMLNNLHNRGVDNDEIAKIDNHTNFNHFPDNIRNEWYYNEIVEATHDHDYYRAANNDNAPENWKDVSKINK